MTTFLMAWLGLSSAHAAQIPGFETTCKIGSFNAKRVTLICPPPLGKISVPRANLQGYDLRTGQEDRFYFAGAAPTGSGK